MSRHLPPIEVLEHRIAPAVIFVNGSIAVNAAHLVVDSSGNDHAVDTVAASTVGATIAVHLSARDTLVLDTNGNRVLDPGEATLVSVTAGDALVFLTDLPTAQDRILTQVSTGDDAARAVAVQPDGKIVVAGEFFNGTNTDILLARYTASGALDAAFGVGGFAKYINASGDDVAHALKLQADGKIVVAGELSNGTDSDIAVLRFNSNGSLDATFDSDGVAIYDGGHGADAARALAIQADNQIVVVGEIASGTDADFGILRFTSAGGLDSAFGTGGFVSKDFGNGDDRAVGVAIQADGKLVVGGTAFSGAHSSFAVVRYLADGTIDSNFGTAGSVTTAIGTGDSTATDVKLQGDERILVAGKSSNGTTSDFALVRYTSVGVLDTTFGTSGKLTTSLSTGDDIANAISIQPDGKILLGGSAGSDFAFARYTTNGVLDTTFNGTGMQIKNISSGNDSVFALTLQTDGKVVAAGAAAGSGADVALVRIETNGSVGATFTIPDNRLQASDLTGLAVSDGFQGVVGTSVKGSIVTALKNGSTLATVSATPSTLQIEVQQHADIAGLAVTGAVDGNVYAGGSMTNVRISGVVAGNLATGTATKYPASTGHLVAPKVSFNGGGTQFDVAAFTQSGGTSGGDISDVRLAAGAKNILAGDGGDSDTNTPGRGGSVNRVTITSDTPVWIRAGNGGISNSASGAPGGSLNAIGVKLTAATTDDLSIRAGNGGRGAFAGAGGAGGSINDFVLRTNGSTGSVVVVAGDGGAADLKDLKGVAGAGGSGGAITNASIQLLGAGSVVKNFSLLAGAGGRSDFAAGGVGGAIVNAQITNVAAIGDSTSGGLYEIRGGKGGAGTTAGGSGGAIVGGQITFLANVVSPATAVIRAGDGADLQSGAGLKAAAGRGGAISALHVTQAADIAGGLTISSGKGGAATGASGIGGSGGIVTASTIDGAGTTATKLAIKSGAGGAGGSKAGAAGNGGNIGKVTVTEAGALAELSITAGDGGTAISGAGGTGGLLNLLRVVTSDVTTSATLTAGKGGKSGTVAGAGGGIVGLTLQNSGAVASLELAGGAGGDATDAGKTGAGGSVTQSTLRNLGSVTTFAIKGGAGGNAGSAGAGGTGGGFTKSTLQNAGSLPDVQVTGGVGGKGGTSTGVGGAGGQIATISLRTLDAKISMIAGDGGLASGKAGGAGGSIDGLTGTFSEASFRAGNGGASTSAAGGAGGAIRHLNFTTADTLVRALIAGNGGDGTTGGLGGGVLGVAVSGDIGDFTKNFDLTTGTGMGGIAVGLGGKTTGNASPLKNGSISTVTAHGIATMIAGRPAANAISTNNAVLKIAKITADLVGADVDGSGTVSHSKTGEYQFNQADDNLLDGIVLVRSGGLAALPLTTLQFNVVKV